MVHVNEAKQQDRSMLSGRKLASATVTLLNWVTPAVIGDLAFCNNLVSVPTAATLSNGLASYHWLLLIPPTE